MHVHQISQKDVSLFKQQNNDYESRKSLKSV